ncbi:hydroxymethylbilane synthase [Pseudocnuella soli]|uniref:hydroxymethylbilane synthase n=1 Tax=Pseudocnuella soli TaxID=2502779 RepID=UPI00195D8C24|nr:hydroxymethylbilane synthase [Pseudocnuella soli]
MIEQPLRIGTRDSQLAVWQATLVQDLLKQAGIASELVYMKSEGDINLTTPLYEIGVTGVFTKVLDIALLEKRIDIAVHSMKDVPTQLANGLQQAAVLERASYKDIFVYKNEADLEALGFANGEWQIVDRQSSNVKREVVSAVASPLTSDVSRFTTPFIIATSSIRRIAQWKHRYPNHNVANLRGNVNTRLRKVAENNWNGAIFAAAGLERINLRPEKAINLDWMLPAPAQGAIMVVCRKEDDRAFEACQGFHHEATAVCVQAERDFLRTLMGGCSTPISALAQMRNGKVLLRGNICAPDGGQMIEAEKEAAPGDASTLGVLLANELLNQPLVNGIVQQVRNGKN